MKRLRETEKSQYFFNFTGCLLVSILNTSYQITEYEVKISLEAHIIILEIRNWSVNNIT